MRQCQVKQRLSKSFRSKRTTDVKFIMLVLYSFGVGTFLYFSICALCSELDGKG